MMECVQVFLAEGLIEGDKEKERIRRLENLTSPEFVEVIDDLVSINEWVDQRVLVDLLKSDIPDLTPHTFTKWMTIYCDENNLKQEKKSSGGEYSFRILKVD